MTARMPEPFGESDFGDLTFLRSTLHNNYGNSEIFSVWIHPQRQSICKSWRYNPLRTAAHKKYVEVLRKGDPEIVQNKVQKIHEALAVGVLADIRRMQAEMPGHIFDIQDSN